MKAILMMMEWNEVCTIHELHELFYWHPIWKTNKITSKHYPSGQNFRKSSL